MAPSDSRSVNCYGHGHLVCKFPINVTVPFYTVAGLGWLVFAMPLVKWMSRLDPT